MQIYRKGFVPPPKHYVIECDACRTLFGFVAAEAAGEIVNWMGDKKTYLTVRCPHCSKELLIEK